MGAQEAFAHTIKDRLLGAGFSYKKFGEELGNIPHQTVSRWVNGQGIPDFERLRPIATVLKIDYDFLYSLWVQAVSERGRRVAGEPIGDSTAPLHENLPSPSAELMEIRQRMEKLEQEVKNLSRKGG